MSNQSEKGYGGGSPVNEPIRKGDREASERLCKELAGPIFCYAAASAGNLTEAEDITQEALLRVYRAAVEGRLRESPRSYAFAVAHNLIVDSRRQRRDVIPFEIRHAATSAQAAERTLLREEIEKALAELPTAHRSAMLLRDFGGMSYGEIAEALGAQVSQVRIWIYRGRRRMADLLDRDGQYIGNRQNEQ